MHLKVHYYTYTVTMPRVQKESAQMKSYNQNGIRFEEIEPLNRWNVFLSNFNKDTIISSELQKYKYEEVVMELSLSEHYPFTPPFVRIISPRFKGYTGFITTGGSLCVDILTINGWVPSFNIISLMNQLKVFIRGGIIHPTKHMIPYTLKEAQNHYNRTTKIHKWDKSD